MNIKSLLLIVFVVFFLHACMADSDSSSGSGGSAGDSTGDSTTDATTDTGGDSTSDATSDTPTTPGSLAYIDLTGAKSALVTSNFSPSANYIPMSTGTNSGLLKITDDGYVLDVPATDASGNEVTLSYDPIFITKANADYTAVYFMDPTQFGGYTSAEDAIRNAHEVFLVNNVTGEAVSIVADGSPHKTIYDFANSTIFEESAGNLYYLAYQDKPVFVPRLRVIKLDLSTMQTTVMTPDSDDVQYFEVDKDGNIAYQGFEYCSGVCGVIYVRKIVTSSGVYTIPPDTPTYMSLDVWLSLEGKFQYNEATSDGSNVRSYYYQINVAENGTPSFDLLYEVPVNASPGVGKTSYYLPTNNNLYVLNTVSTGFVEACNGTNTPVFLSYADYNIDSVDLATSDNTSIYIAGNNLSGQKILKRVTRGLGAASTYHPMDVTENGTTDLISPNKYSISKMVPNGSGGIIFTGTRLSDNESVVGEIDSVGNDTIFATGSQAEADALVRL